MITVGQILKDARLKKKISLNVIEQKTKIKKEFIVSLEETEWDKLPEFPIVSGFVKNIAVFLGLNPENINAILRRDYPPKKLPINPTPDIESKFTWSPKFTFAIGIGLIIFIVLGYLLFEYSKFIKPPEITVTSPKEEQMVNGESVKIEGKTTTDVSLTVNNQPVILDQEGRFVTEIKITKETKNLIFKAVSRSGKVTEKNISITVE